MMCFKVVVSNICRCFCVVVPPPDPDFGKWTNLSGKNSHLNSICMTCYHNAGQKPNAAHFLSDIQIDSYSIHQFSIFFPNVIQNKPNVFKKNHIKQVQCISHPKALPKRWDRNFHTQTSQDGFGTSFVEVHEAKAAAARREKKRCLLYFNHFI